jgi:hypothetical protein
VGANPKDTLYVPKKTADAFEAPAVNPEITILLFLPYYKSCHHLHREVA